MPKVPPTFDQFSRPPDPGIDFSGTVSKTKMEFAAECDLNVIMRRYTETGELPESIVGTYGDFSEPLDFQTAQNIIARADAQFSALPAEVRARFQNDPAQFLAFVHDEKNYDEARELGLLDREAVARREAAAAAAAAPGAAVAVPVTPAPSLAKPS